MTLQDKIQALPNSPGVYLMKNKEDKIIYVGKAVSLKNRVKSYFQAKPHDSAKTRALVKNIQDIEYILTDSELEALILECNLIKKHRPKYNISLKDDKTYPYLRITKEDFPRVLVTRKLIKDGSKYFGPYTSVTSLRETVELLQKLFRFRNCNPGTFNANRACLNAHIERCSAPCVGKISKAEYNENIKQIILFLEGKQEDLVQNLEQEMQKAAAELNFEKAALLRDQIQSIKQIMERQKIVSEDSVDQDVIAMARGFNESCVQIFFVRNGKIIGRENYFLKGTDDTDRAEIIQSFIKQYYNSQDLIPAQILIETDIPEAKILEQWLTKKRGSRVYINVPKRGKKKDLVDLVGRNALETMEKADLDRQHKKAMTEDAVMELKRELSLEKVPLRIECYDISNTQGTESVGSMVVFEEGRPKKEHYRRFKIKTVEGPNDFASIYEVVSRRFKRAGEEQGAFSKLPDLVLIDGGKGQLEYARKAMVEEGYSEIPTYAIAEKEDWLITQNHRDPIILPRSSKALYLLQRIRDEAHRFAITYHRSLRGKRNLASILNDIPGVGENRKQNLLKHFGSFKKVQKASVEELLEVPGINRKVAQNIYDYLRSHQDLKLRMTNNDEDYNPKI
ncbi:MAG: excinuclease ABC subunit UvrC [Clostridia bacterium]|jgi:excinuclease ABC subunit C|nr:excinuclease ABC subunit UvrC [Clostridia bacterium]